MLPLGGPGKDPLHFIWTRPQWHSVSVSLCRCATRKSEALSFSSSTSFKQCVGILVQDEKYRITVHGRRDQYNLSFHLPPFRCYKIGTLPRTKLDFPSPKRH